MKPLGCSRRGFLTAGTALGATAALTIRPGWAPRLARAAGALELGAPPPTGRLVVVFLRGGMDALSAVVPAGDPTYHDARPTIAVPDDAVVDLDGTFGLHPAWAPLHDLYRTGRLAFVHAVGNPAGSRSHFDAQDLMEMGTVERRADGTGWLARHLATSGTDHLFRAVCLSNTMTGSLLGSHALATPSLARFALGGFSGATAGYESSLRMAHHGAMPVEVTGTAALDAIDRIATLDAPPSDPTDSYAPFADAAVLLDSDLGVEVVTINVDGWDTHDQMGTHESGQMATLLDGLAQDLVRFQAELDGRGLGNVTTVVMSEFGRCVEENGSGGTDHGFGGLMVAMGSGIRGGRVLTDWPGLEQHHHHDDLMVTTDYRDVLWELARDVLGNPSPQDIFTDHDHTPVGLTA